MTDPAVLITGASTAIGATNADRLTRRGHGLVLVTRDEGRLDGPALRPNDDAGVAVEVLPADLTQPDQFAVVKPRLHDNDRIGVRIDNAGAGFGGSFTDQPTDAIDWLAEHAA
ncbi:SDR family NAD(P)-dependent oxidoreductase [Sphingomonas sp. Leaf22]|uniref:SDR family NAD(P)-dependent oxidoreductase n=1 Tax=Sphingomonas sp. Leaf22 TaxID=1735687 RepID=UPI000A621893|nr:SDR family NAD(P)-dependent oxidoreductase [Sphingomonas sp. Leaf22]